MNRISHIRSDAGSEFRSDVFRKWCSENKIRFTTAAPKHQEQNGLVERHWGTILKLANTMIIHARLSKKFFYYAVKYAQFIHDVIPVKDLLDENGLPCTPNQLENIQDFKPKFSTKSAQYRHFPSLNGLSKPFFSLGQNIS